MPLPRLHRRCLFLSCFAISFLGFAVLAFVFALAFLAFVFALAFLAFGEFLEVELVRSGNKVLSRFTTVVDLTQGREESKIPLYPP